MRSLLGSFSLSRWVRAKRSEIRLVLRITIAAVLAYASGKLIGLPQGTWNVITAVIIMQASLGGSVKAAMDRMAGTLVGALWGATISLILPHDTPFDIALIIVVAMVPTALCAALNASFRVAPITALIVLVPSGAAAAASPLVYAVERVGEIVVGIVVGVGVALFVLPARAQDQLMATAAKVAEHNAEMMTMLITALVEGRQRPDVAALQAGMRATLRQMDASVDEAVRERRIHLSARPDIEPLVRTLYRIRHDLVIIARACTDPLPDVVMTALAGPLIKLRDESDSLLRATALALRGNAPSPDATSFDTSLQAFVAAMDGLRAAGVMPTLQSQDIARMYTLRFALEQLGLDLNDLVERDRTLKEGAQA